MEEHIQSYDAGEFKAMPWHLHNQRLAWGRRREPTSRRTCTDRIGEKRAARFRPVNDRGSLYRGAARASRPLLLFITHSAFRLSTNLHLLFFYLF